MLRFKVESSLELFPDPLSLSYSYVSAFVSSVGNVVKRVVVVVIIGIGIVGIASLYNGYLTESVCAVGTFPLKGFCYMTFDCVLVVVVSLKPILPVRLREADFIHSSGCARH